MIADPRVHIDAVLAALSAGLPSSYEVHEAQGPDVPELHYPYVVLFATIGRSEGEPFCPGRDLCMTISVRGEGSSPVQAQAGAIRARNILLSGVSVAGRSVSIYEDDMESPPVQRDDTLTPANFSQLVIFDLLSRPE